MTEKQAISAGDTVKIERTEKGWRATVTGAGNSWHVGKPFYDFPTFDEAVSYLKSSFDVA